MEEFINYAHRGASEYYPENTFLAFYTGLAMGANGIETDVQMSRDRIPVLFHDRTLERMTGKPGSIGEYTYDELMEELRRLRPEELCPRAGSFTKEDVQKWHGMGLRVRAWGVKDEELMRQSYQAGVDGMTVNFPDKLARYLVAPASY